MDLDTLNVVAFLREKKILDPNSVKWYVYFHNGFMDNVDLIQLINEYHQQAMSKLRDCPKCGLPFPTPKNITAPTCQCKKHSTHPIPTGWVCPRCGIVNSPYAVTCNCPNINNGIEEVSLKG